MKVLLPRASW